MQSLMVFQEEIKNVIRTDFELELLDDSCLFAEGPVWSREGFYLFSDIPSNTVERIIPGQAKEVYIKASGCGKPGEAELPRMMGSNGLAYDADGTLLVCQHGNHAVARYDGRLLEPFLMEYNGRPLNSPNDIVADRQGRIFFSDPPYGLKGQVANAEKYQDRAGFYCWREGQLIRFWDRYEYPNGVCLSADQKWLYACTNKPFEAGILEFDVHSLELKRVVAKETSDGIKCDVWGNLYLCNKEGVLILNNRGERLGLIRLPTIPANICWGGREGRDLLIAAGKYIFFIPDLLKC